MKFNLRSYPGFLFVVFITMLFVSSCSATREAGLIDEDRMFVTRKYVGNFVSYSRSSPYYKGGPKVISITTTLDSVYGKISAYSHKCEFEPGERLYIRRVSQPSGLFSNWKYQIENDRETRISYGIMEFKYGDKVLVQNWY
jgi:hypothetical protein